MLLCSADIEETRSKEIFRPLEVTYPAIDNVEALITHWLKSQPLSQDVEVTLEKKSNNGDGNGVGAVWAAWTTSLSSTKQHAALKKVRHLIEVKSVIPNQQIVLIISVDPSSVTVGKTNPKAFPPAYLTITAVGKGDSTELTAKLAATIPSAFQTFWTLFYLPCCWPHLILMGVCMTVCYPCCKQAATITGKQGLANQCDQGLSAIKSAVEKGPQQQVMSDHHAPPAYVAAPSSSSNGDKNPFCTKCGNPVSPQDTFCGKCGSPH